MRGGVSANHTGPGDGIKHACLLWVNDRLRWARLGWLENSPPQVPRCTMILVDLSVDPEAPTPSRANGDLAAAHLHHQQYWGPHHCPSGCNRCRPAGRKAATAPAEQALIKGKRPPAQSRVKVKIQICDRFAAMWPGSNKIPTPSASIIKSDTNPYVLPFISGPISCPLSPIRRMCA